MTYLPGTIKQTTSQDLVFAQDKYRYFIFHNIIVQIIRLRQSVIICLLTIS